MILYNNVKTLGNISYNLNATTTTTTVTTTSFKCKLYAVEGRALSSTEYKYSTSTLYDV